MILLCLFLYPLQLSLSTVYGDSKRGSDGSAAGGGVSDLFQYHQLIESLPGAVLSYADKKAPKEPA